jgi:hypothetical protein
MWKILKFMYSFRLNLITDGSEFRDLTELCSAFSVFMKKKHQHMVQNSAVIPVPDTASLTSEDECKWY